MGDLLLVGESDRLRNMTTEIERLINEGNAILRGLDVLGEQQSKVERTWGSMALSSYRSDKYQEAMRKFHEAFELDKEAELAQDVADFYGDDDEDYSEPYGPRVNCTDDDCPCEKGC